jgi:hypothetical protein
MNKYIRIATISLAAVVGLAAGAEKHEERAEKLERKAARHEAKANELANRKGYNPMAQKWPAMVQGPIDRERQLAAKARGQAAEARTLAAAEAQSSPADAGSR